MQTENAVPRNGEGKSHEKPHQNTFSVNAYGAKEIVIIVVYYHYVWCKLSIFMFTGIHYFIIGFSYQSRWLYAMIFGLTFSVRHKYYFQLLFPLFMYAHK